MGLKKLNLVNNCERVDDLQFKGAKIIQNPNLYTFANDPILLVNFAKIKSSATVVDMCSGSGVIGILCALKSNAKIVYGIEIQQVMAQMSERSIALNNLTDRVRIINDDIKNYVKYIQKASVDVVFCNPPYFKKDTKKICDNNVKTIARHEIYLTLEDVIRVASEMLNSKGEFYLVHQAERLQEICALYTKYKLAIKQLMLVQSNREEKPHLVLVKAVKDGASGTEILPNLVLNKKDGTFTTKVQKIYKNKSINKKDNL